MTIQVNNAPQSANFHKQNSPKVAFKGLLKIPMANIKNMGDSFELYKALDDAGPLGTAKGFSKKIGHIFQVVNEEKEAGISAFLDKTVGKGKYTLEKFAGAEEGDFRASINKYYDELDNY